MYQAPMHVCPQLQLRIHTARTMQQAERIDESNSNNDEGQTDS